MWNRTKTITILLAIAAVSAWLIAAIVPGRIIIGYGEAQVPMAVTLSAAACFGWFLLWLSVRRGDHETRCRKCGYILRGLREPRCSECGEPI